MPIGYAIDVSRRVVFVRVWGIFTDELLNQLAPAIRELPDFEPGFFVLSDLRGVTKFAIDHRFVAGHAAASAFRHESRRAVVVASNESMGMTRMYEQVGHFEEGLRIFHDLAPAFEWLSLPPETVIPPDVGVIGMEQEPHPPHAAQAAHAASRGFHD